MTAATEKLLTEALRLPPRDRAELARLLAESVEEKGAIHKGRASWASVRAAIGVVHLGGDAVKDCEQLYDG